MDNGNNHNPEVNVDETLVVKKSNKGLKYASIILIVAMLIGLVALTGAVAINEFHASSEYQNNYRNCSTRLDGEVTVEGIREISFYEQTMFGTKFIASSSITEKTKFKLDGTQLTVIGKGPDGYWVKQAGQGEQGFMPVEDAHEYVIVKNGKFTALTAKDFCRPGSTQKIMTVDAKKKTVKEAKEVPEK